MTGAGKRRSLVELSPEEVTAHTKTLQAERSRRRGERRRAKRLGLEVPALLVYPASDDAERKRRHADRERARRANLGESYRETNRLRQKNPARKARQRETQQSRYIANKRRVIESVVAWQRKNPALVKQYAKTASLRVREDPERLAQQQAARRARDRQKFAESPAFRILKNLRSSLRQALRLYGNGRKTTALKQLVGCTMEELVTHIESLWEPWMKWSNYGRPVALIAQGLPTWVIDHRRPCSSFDLTDQDEQRSCFHYSNLQPMEFLENIRKGKRFPIGQAALLA